jgi:endonuclease/exonuclease/phosphatase family metal-dependent hydrolase
MTKTLTIGTFNIENLFMRYKFFYSPTKKKGETEEQAKKRQEEEEKKAFAEFQEKGAYITNIKKFLEVTKSFKSGQTANTAKVILAHKPQIMVLQEVEDMDALRTFNSDPQYLDGFYKHCILIDGNDPRKIDVAVLSNLPITYLKTNIDVKDPVSKRELFSRDCLEVGIGQEENGITVLTLFINHFKSQFAKSAKEEQSAKEKRGRQAEWVANTLKQRYGSNLLGGDFIVLGDFNTNFDSTELQPLLQLSGTENIVQSKPLTKLKIPGQDQITDEDRWTHYLEGKNMISQLDYILLSPSLAQKSSQEEVIIEKRGLAAYAKKYKGERFPGVGPSGTEASDHCAIFTTIKI